MPADGGSAVNRVFVVTHIDVDVVVAVAVNPAARCRADSRDGATVSDTVTSRHVTSHTRQ